MRRLRLASALRFSEARSHAVLFNAVDAIVTIEQDGTIESVNPAAERVFGYAPATLPGKDVSVLMPRPFANEHARHLRRYLDTGEASIIGIGREVIARRADGSTFPADLAVSEMIVDGRRLFTGVLRDLSERRRLEREILRAADAEQVRIGQDLHDGLGQQLTAIAFLVKSLEQRLGRGAPPAAELEDARELSQLVGQALAQNRALSRGLYPAMLDEGGLRAALQQLAGGAAEIHRIDCAVEPASVPTPDVHDPARATHLYRIAQEAIANAVRHGRATSIRLALERRGPDMVLTIADNGCGLTAAPAASSKGRTQAGDRGTAAASSAGRPVGSGLGLHTMRYRAAAIGGTLDVRFRRATMAPHSPTEPSRAAPESTTVICNFPSEYPE